MIQGKENLYIFASYLTRWGPWKTGGYRPKAEIRARD